MAVLVEHEKRKHEILSKALDLFIEEGYEDVTFQKIADRCGITRTTLYIYFKNKREIFVWSIKQMTSALELELMQIINDQTLSAPDCLKKMFSTIIDECEKNYKLFKILLLYVIQLQKSGINSADRVARRVIRMQHLMSTVIIRGQKSGQIKKLPVKNLDGLLYSLMESSIFRLSVLGQTDISSCRQIIDFTIDTISENKN